MRLTWCAVGAIAALAATGGLAMAQSSLGIGASEPTVQSTGFLAGFFQWIAAAQREFYRSMTEALRAMREDGSAFWVLVGLSFMYGIFHAAGPGHGKVVISSYMVANETALRRGIALSFASSMVQALSAIVIVGSAYVFLRGTSFSMTDAASLFETASYALIALFGGWLLWRKLLNWHNLAHSNLHHADIHLEHDHDHDGVCSTCGHAHAPDAKQAENVTDWKSAFGAVMAVGIRPCTGAIVVLSFALLNGLYAGGIASVFAMALGTAITVSALAMLAVTAKTTALRISGSTAMSSGLHLGIEVTAAALLMLIGLLLLGAALFG